jgi:predicted RND superfamily exporter protein
MTTNKEAKVYQLVQELEEAVKQKKAVVSAHNNNIKRIKEEIKDIIDSKDEEEAND